MDLEIMWIEYNVELLKIDSCQGHVQRKDNNRNRTLVYTEAWGQEEKSVNITSRSNQKEEKITEDIFREAKKNGTF